MLQGLRNIGQAREEPGRDADGVVQQSVGEMLETRRAEFGLDLRDVSSALRIRLPYLIAIEEGRLDALPGTTYAIGFVRAYADHLGLDGPAVVERYKNETAALDNAAQLVFPSPLPEGKVPSATILLVAVLALAVIYGGWLVLSSNGRPLAELVPALPESFRALIGADEADTSKNAPSSVSASPSPVTGVAPLAQKPALEGSRAPDATKIETPKAPTPTPVVVVDNTPPAPAISEPTSAEPPTVVAPDPEGSAGVAEEGSAGVAEEGSARVAENNQASVPAPPAPPETPATVVVETVSPDVASAAPQNDITPAPATTDLAPPAPPAQSTRAARRYGAENTDARVVIRATDDSWVQIRDKEGKLLLTRVLRVGDSYWAPNESGVVMRTGNAGGLEIRVDGKAVPGLGPKGAIRHEVALDAEQLKAGTAIRR